MGLGTVTEIFRGLFLILKIWKNFKCRINKPFLSQKEIKLNIGVVFLRKYKVLILIK